jgi:hypothetical protein
VDEERAFDGTIVAMRKSTAKRGGFVWLGAIALATFLSSSSTAGGSGDIPGCGTILFEEPFDDNNFASRGWYDAPSGAISTAEHVAGSPASFECTFASSAVRCSGGRPARHKFPETQSVYLSFHLKFSGNWVGSDKPYHPHMFHFLTNLDDDFVGPANSFLTTYAEVTQGHALLSLQDSKNVDSNCILRGNDVVVGCNGNFNSYKFTEKRSVAACNGILGDLDRRTCYDADGYWYSARSWWSGLVAFGDGPGPFAKNDWHFVEVYMEMNSIADGIGVPNGKIRWVQDGQTLISSDRILFRTGAHPTMAFSQFAMLPYIGDGSPVIQRFWADKLTVATARPGECGPAQPPDPPILLDP